MKEIRRQSGHPAVACAMAGAATGIADGLLANVTGELAFHLAAIAATGGLLIGWFIGGVHAALRPHSIGRRLLRDGPTVAVFLGPAAVLHYAAVHHLSLHAVEPRLWILPLCFALTAKIAYHAFSLDHFEHTVRRLAVAGVAMLVTALWLTGTGLQNRPDLLAKTLNDTALGGQVVSSLRSSSLLDRDGDRFPWAFCASDCDCDDTNSALHPGAKEIPGDGIDQDCSGADVDFIALGPPAAGEQSGGPEAGWVSPSDMREALHDARAVVKPEVLPDLLLITVDTLRSDHLGAYGYPRNTSPRIDSLAEGGVLFEQARSQGPMTAWSMSSMVAGLHFTSLERSAGKWPRVSGPYPVLGERLAEVGYYGAGFAPQFYFRKRYGLARGFHHWDTKVARLRHPFHQKVSGDVLADRVIKHLHRLPEDKPALIWMHFGDPHSDYLRHKGFSKFGYDTKGMYDGEIRFTDHQIGRVLDTWDELDRDRPFVGVLTADHGEDLVKEEDHGHRYHGSHLFDTLVKVPLIVWGTDIESQTVETPVGVIDVLPSLMEAAGLPRDPRLAGSSLFPFIRGERPRRGPVFSEKPTPPQKALKSMVAWPYKLVWQQALNLYSLYDLQADPRELNDIFGEDAARDARLVERMVRWRDHELKELPPKKGRRR